jgi:S-formylglutathione hydrolase FrmB
MPIKRATWPQGQIVEIEHTSKVLRNNPLGDPCQRKLHVWLPPGYKEGSGQKALRSGGRLARLPVLFDLVGFTASGLAHTNWKNFGENVPERAARLIHEGRMGPTILVFPDCFTAYGGNQYINSSAIGNYGDYLVEELIPLIDREFRTLASRAHRGCFGKSSGGYGAIVHAMRYHRYWGAVADHSGDAYFDFVYRSDWPRTLDALSSYADPKREPGAIDVLSRQKGVAHGLDDGRVKRFLESFWRKRKASGNDTHVLMMLCMAATYDPDPKAPNGFRLPFNLETGELLERRWKKWLRHDPIHMVDAHLEALRTLRGIWIDCGWSDQYFIHYGARILSKKLTQGGVAHVYEEFPDNHSDIDYRLDSSLPYLYQALRP